MSDTSMPDTNPELAPSTAPTAVAPAPEAPAPEAPAPEAPAPEAPAGTPPPAFVTTTEDATPEQMMADMGAPPTPTEPEVAAVNPLVIVTPPEAPPAEKIFATDEEYLASLTEQTRAEVLVGRAAVEALGGPISAPIRPPAQVEYVAPASVLEPAAAEEAPVVEAALSETVRAELDAGRRALKNKADEVTRAQQASKTAEAARLNTGAAPQVGDMDYPKR